METKATLGIVVMVLAMSTLTFASNVQLVEAAGTIYIRPDGSVDPPTAAIERNGDVYAFIDSIYDPILVNKSNVVLDGAGFTLQGSGSGSGIDIHYVVSYVTIKNMTITNWGCGIFMRTFMGLFPLTSHNTISQNNITGNGLGIKCEGLNHSILDNNIKNNGFGIEFGGHDGAGYNTVSRNKVTNNGYGIRLERGASYNDVSLNEISGNSVGLAIGGDYAFENIIRENSIIQNAYGITGFTRCAENRIYHNNFIENDEQVYSLWRDVDGRQIWNDSYPSGGNYWSDYTGVDVKTGPYQDQAGSDRIGDIPHIISPYSEDRARIDADYYPLMTPWVGTMAAVDVEPDCLSLRSKIRWITAYIELPAPYSPEGIDVLTIRLNGAPAEPHPTQIGDYDSDGILDLMVKFNAANVTPLLRADTNRLAVTGNVNGRPFEGIDTVKVIA